MRCQRSETLIERWITGFLLIVAIIHLLPFGGFVGSAQISALYDVDVSDDNLAILMRHRAVMFGLLGAFFVYAAFKPTLQPVAFIAAAVSIMSFFYLAFSVGDFNAAIRKIVVADVVAGSALACAVVLYFVKHRA